MNNTESLLNFLTESLIDNKSKYRVNRLESDNNILYSIQVSKDDLGRVIGKGGKTANAIRSFIYACNRNGKKINIKFEEL
ncbi:RNA-binding protein [candidate division TA06 bacterium]|uniref:RNA-binding protein KhpA n=1 Tax=candidate division TA06 bacterium TaxID=2250710 RepID=A0A660SI61_UNCT6|nr:MAG: RNA-binding protein [candidate division TA06 bacterium]